MKMQSAFGREFLDEFDEHLEFLVEEAAQAIAEAINSALSLATSNGGLGNGRLQLLVLEATDPIVDKMREHMLAAYEVRRKSRLPDSDRLKDHLCEHAGKIYDRMPSLVLPYFIRMSLIARGFIQDEVDRRRERHEQLISQHLGGVKISRQGPADAASAFPTNHLNAISMRHADAFIHQDHLGNEQNRTIDIDWHGVRAAAAELREVLSRPEIGGAVRDALGPDLDTIAAQLRKPTPNDVVVREAGRSLRHVVTAEIVRAPRLAPLVHKITSAIGLG